MENELEQKIFVLTDYIDKLDMEEHIKSYVKTLKENYPMAIVTREFYKGKNVLVRATQINNRRIENKKEEQEKEKEQGKERIKERGINGTRENGGRTRGNVKSRENEIGHSGGNGRERGGR